MGYTEDNQVRSTYVSPDRDLPERLHLPKSGPRDLAEQPTRKPTPMKETTTKRETVAEALRQFGQPMTTSEIWRHSSRRIRGTRKQLSILLINNTNAGFFVRREINKTWYYWLPDREWPENTPHERPIPTDTRTPVADDRPMDPAQTTAAPPPDAPDLDPSEPQGPDETNRTQNHEPDPLPLDDPLLIYIRSMPLRKPINKAKHIPRLHTLAGWMNDGGDDKVANWLLELAAELESAA